MDNNSFIYGKIPTSSGGISKTYPESIIRLISENEERHNHIISYSLSNHKSREKLYLEKSTNNIVLESKRNDNDSYKELVVLSVFPYGGISSHGYEYFSYLIEVIEKDTLYRHLKDERMIIERELQNEQKLRLK